MREQAMESEELMKAENERLIAEIASLKKKVKLAVKKVQADFQAKIQAAEERVTAAEERAAAAEAAALVVNGTISRSNSEVAAPRTPENGENGAMSVSSSPSHPLSSPGDSLLVRGWLSSSSMSNREVIQTSRLSDADSVSSRAALEKLVAELKAERELRLAREDESVKDRQRLEDALVELRTTKDAVVRQREEARAKFEEELRLVKEDGEKRAGHLTEANEKLERQLMGAAEQVAEAFARMSSMNDDLDHMLTELHETKRSHSNLAIECESIRQELEQSRTALTDTQQKLRDKSKEMEEMAAARKAAQEGQEAAMSQLIHRLDEMEAAGTGQQAEHLRELNADRVQSLLQEKGAVQKELEKSSEMVSNLQEEIRAYQHRLLSVEISSQNEIVPEIRSLDSRDLHRMEMSIPELRAQNETMVSQLEEVRSQAAADQELRLASEQAASLSLKELTSLREQLEVSRASQEAAESQIKRLSVAFNEAEQQVTTLTQQCADACRRLDEEVKIRDDKYSELDAKFGRLQKRAKQRIQEVQKDKEEVETQLAAATERAAEALSKQAAAQGDLDRARLQAGEALRNLDSERQQLRMANIKLRDEVEEVRRTLEGKEHNLAESRRLASEKDQSALEMASMLKEAEANHEAAVLEIKEKYQKVEENLRAQLADATEENIKMTETISFLQAQLGIKESQLAELDAASSGEVARLGASLEASRREVSRLELEHRKEQETWQGSSEKLKRKLEESEKVIHQQEVTAAQLKRQFESELERQHQVLSTAQADLSAARDETARIASDLASYKVRAYALLQKKEAELLAAKDSDLAAAQEAALQNAKREAVVAAAEKDSAVKALQDAVLGFENELAARDVALLDAEQRIRDLATKLEASRGQLIAEKDDSQRRLEQIEAHWRLKYEALEAKGSVENDLRHEYSALLNDYTHLKEEFESFRDLVDTMNQDKDTEITRLLEENANLQKSSASQAQVRSEVVNIKAAPLQPDEESVPLAEQQILLLARQQALREEEVSQCRRHIQALQEEVTDLEYENRLHSQQEMLLKEELRNMERAHKRDGVDMTYLKNVILKLLETGEVEALLPVVAMLLQFSPEELKRCHDTYNNATINNVPLSGAAAVVDTAVSAPRSFFSKLNFTG